MFAGRGGGTKRGTGEKGEREGQVERMAAGGGVVEGEGQLAGKEGMDGES